MKKGIFSLITFKKNKLIANINNYLIDWQKAVVQLTLLMSYSRC